MNKNVGFGKDKDSETSITQSGIGTGNITVTNSEKQKELTGQTAEEAAQGIQTDLTTETADANSGGLENIFDKEKVQAEIDLQVKVTQQFDRTRQDMKQIINTKIDEYKDSDPEKAKDWQNAGLQELYILGVKKPQILFWGEYCHFVFIYLKAALSIFLYGSLCTW